MAHTDDLAFLFNQSSAASWNDQDEQVANSMCTLWTNFASTQEFGKAIEANNPDSSYLKINENITNGENYAKLLPERP